MFSSLDLNTAIQQEWMKNKKWRDAMDMVDGGDWYKMSYYMHIKMYLRI